MVRRCAGVTEHSSQIRANNLTERANREIRRCTRAIAAFLDGNSALMLVCAGLRHVVASKWGSKRYMDMEHLFKMEIQQLDDEEILHGSDSINDSCHLAYIHGILILP